MRLSVLDPTWLSADGRERMGILFRCPACLDGDRGHGLGHYIAVYFADPPDGGPPASAAHVPSARWRLVDDTFEALTITPSINVRGCWHGWIREGEVTTC